MSGLVKATQRNFLTDPTVDITPHPAIIERSFIGSQKRNLMKHTVRIGNVEDQDRWRRDDLRACSPDERVEMLLQLQADHFAGQDQTLVRVAHVKRMNNG